MKFLSVLAVFVCTTVTAFPAIENRKAYFDLRQEYKKHVNHDSDIVEHLPVLRHLATQCASVTEIGVRSMVSTWAILTGLSENIYTNCSYVGIDLNYPPSAMLNKAMHLAVLNGISFQFIAENDMNLEIAPTDLLFIDSLHTYCHLTYELETFSSQTKRYIALHDTSEPWGERDDDKYVGDYSEYPLHYDRTKRGLWAAVEDFLESHPEWILQERRFNNHGFTVLKRVEGTARKGQGTKGT